MQQLFHSMESELDLISRLVLVVSWIAFIVGVILLGSTDNPTGGSH